MSAALETSASPGGLPFRIDGAPDFAMVCVRLPAGASLHVEASSMAAMDANVRMKTKLRGGLRRLLIGESLFINEFTAEQAPGEIQVAPGSPGDIRHVALRGETLYLQSAAFLCASAGVAVETQWQGLVKGFFGGGGLFLARAVGTGELWFNSFGGMIEHDVDGAYCVDTGHVVAFTAGLDYRVRPVGGYKSLFFSGEGLVCEFTGRGKVWIQTRKLSPFLAWLRMFQPVRRSN